jgi:phosphohistidine phosphatase
MDLILWRHAEAEDGAPDKSRALTTKGKHQASVVADWLKARLPKDSRVIASPAKRCRQTAATLTEEFEEMSEVGVGASAAAVLSAAGWPDAGGAVVVVGHQPTLGQVASLLLAGQEADWGLKKGAIWWFSHRGREMRGELVLKAVLPPDLA